MLESGDSDVILSALFSLGGRTGDAPAGELLEKASTLFAHPDPDVRRQAVFSVAIHWGYVPALRGLLGLLATEQDEEVLDAAVSAVARMGRESPESRAEALSALRRVASDEKRSRRASHQAYVEARWMCGESSPAEHAKEGLAPERVPLNLAWFDQALRR
ncbi:HEAT repeat domain-containing protein [Corallococcus sicarius]|nr:HEAT repeat domain-containing protein [Corallococcus sicarius]